MIPGLLTFAITYLLIAGRRLRALPIDRPAGALIGAVLAVATGALTPDEAMRAVDGRTIVLLFAVMGMGAFLDVDGFFDRATPFLANRVRTRAGLLAAIVWGAGVLAPFITNDAVCVLGAPVVVTWIRRFKLPRLPFLLALATASNTGSVATLVGNPQNMLCASLGGLSFRTYLLHLAPVAVVALAVNHAILYAFFRGELREPLEAEERPSHVMTGRSWITVAVLGGTVVAYTAGADLTMTALAGLVVLMLVFRIDPQHVWSRIDWSVLVFFGALFVAVDAIARSGAAEYVFRHVPVFVGPPSVLAYLRASLSFLVGSNLVTNVPFILIVKGEVARMPAPGLGWELLAMASTFGGNLTLLGSVANIIVAEKGREVGGLGFGEYLKVGLPVALATTVLGTTWLALVG